MSRILLIGLITSAWVSANAESSASLGLTSADLGRLGVVLQPPQSVTEIEIASGPAEVVIPPAQEAIVSATVEGVLSRVLVAEADFVSAGQPLAEIRSAELLGLQRAYIDAAVAADLASTQLERDRGLYADGIIAERRLRESAAAERAASTALEQLRQQLALAGMTDTELAHLLQTGELSPTLTLRAPFSAVIVEQISSLGARVDVLEPVYRVADLSRLWLEVHVPQERAARIVAGMRVTASTANRTLDADVTHVGQVLDGASQTVVVRADVDNHDQALRAGQFLPARILAVSNEPMSALAVPSAAIVRVDGDAFVFVRRNDEVGALLVEILGEDSASTYIRASLEPGVEVVVEGVAALKSVWVAGQAEGS